MKILSVHMPQDKTVCHQRTNGKDRRETMRARKSSKMRIFYKDYTVGSKIIRALEIICVKNLIRNIVL